MAGATMLALGLTSCNQPARMDDATRNQRIDSAYAAQRSTVIDQMNRDCVDNMQARVQMKTDSLVNVAQASTTNM